MAYTRQIINVGTTADDGSGDYLRDALVKVNTNFENLWTQSAVDSNIDLTGNTISTVISNLDIKLDPNGSGKIVVTSDIEPDTDGQHDIGSSTKKFNNIHTEKFSTESGVFDGQTSDPSNPVTGQVYYNSSTNKLKVYDGAWKNINTTSSAGIELTDLSVGAEASASGDGGIAYDNTSGVFTYTPPVIPTNNNQLTNGAGFITSYTVTESDVTSHQAALSITESQISDLGSYITASSTETLTNKSGNVSMFTNDSGYTTNTGDITRVNITAGTGLTGTQDTTTGDHTQTLNVDVGTTANKILQLDGSGRLPAVDGSQLTGVSSGNSSFNILTGDGSTVFSAVAGTRYGVDTSGGTATVNLPGSPSTGDAIFFADAGGSFLTNNLTVGRNGNTIMGLSENMTVSTNNDSFGLFYNGSTWRTYS